MPEALEIAIQIFENGITVVTFLAVLNVIFTWYESHRKRLAYERMESKLDALMQKEGVPWIGQQNECHKALTSLRRLPQLYSVDIYRAGYLLRRGRKMQLSKAWMVGLIGYISFFIKQAWGIEVTDEVIDKVAEFTLLAITLIPIFVNMVSKKGAKQVESHDFGESTK